LHDPLPDASGFWTEVQEDEDSRRRVEDDQGSLSEIAGIVGISEPADGNFRRLV
jgi:hypothetical protein